MLQRENDPRVAAPPWRGYRPQGKSPSGQQSIINQEERMNSLTLIFAALCIFAIGYRFYGVFIANKVMELRD